MNLMNLELLFENIRGGCFCAFNEFCKTNNLEIILIKAFTTNETARLFSNNIGSQHVFKENWGSINIFEQQKFCTCLKASNELEYRDNYLRLENNT